MALVGLAKNTGKTETLAAMLRELNGSGRVVGVTSIGRDGEERDVIDPEIRKPRVLLGAGSLVASTDTLLRASGLHHELLASTAIRTPLGRVVVARLQEAGPIEVAGPSTSAGVRSVTDAMLGEGAEQVLIDGAIDRRAASSPEVSDRLVMSTGAVLSEQLEEVVRATCEAVELVQLASVDERTHAGRRLREIAAQAPQGASMLVEHDHQALPLPPRFALSASSQEIGVLLDGHPGALCLILAGALPEEFLSDALSALRARRRELRLILADPSKVFLARRSPAWYRTQGIEIQVLAPIELAALTVNPLAPRSHSFDSRELRSRLSEELGAELAIFDVLHPDYPGGRG